MVALAERLVATGTPGTLATLFSAHGSTYRPLGSMMVSTPGMRAGGISGGCLEEYVARAGERETRHRPAAMLDFSTHPDADDNVPTLGCGGSIAVLIERLTLGHVRMLEQLGEAYERDDGSILACIVTRSGPALSVWRTWFDPVDTLPVATPALADICMECMRAGRSAGTSLSEDTDVLAQYVPPLTRLVIVGAGDDARPLCALGAQLGWHVSVVDRRARLATSARFPDADQVVAAEWDEAIETLTLTPRTAVVLMTHNLEDDARALSLLSTRTMAYIGALGPAHRRAWLLEEAATRHGYLSPGFVSRVKGPIGLDLGDRSAAGIAVAVTAEILAHLNARTGRNLHNDAASNAWRPGVCLAAAV
jgi:xanthine/CO dehydrogenase XdhC/CoxF family maturation factor